MPPEESIDGVYRKAALIAERLRTSIVDGEFGPGDRLPTRNALTREYGVSKVTIQRALDRLVDEGFVVARNRQGTFVAHSSPHLTRYALLFPYKLDEHAPNQNWYAMVQEAQRYSAERRIVKHYGFDGPDGLDRYRQLLDDVRNRRLAGLIFATPPFRLLKTPLITAPGIPRAAFMGFSPMQDLPAVRLSITGLHARLAELVAAGPHRRLAILMPSKLPRALSQALLEQLRGAGIDVGLESVHGLDVDAPHWAESLVRVLMLSTEPPDCILVLDDNLLPPVTAALARLGHTDGAAPRVISHCNFPWPTASEIPVTRVGFCMRECLSALMAMIDQQRDGADAVPDHVLQVYTDSDYPAFMQAPTLAASVDHSPHSFPESRSRSTRVGPSD